MRQCYLFTTLLLIFIINHVYSNPSKPTKACLMCCGKPPCCNCCGLPNCDGTNKQATTDINTKSIKSKRAFPVPISKPGPPTMCLNCCGKPPCCNTCGLDPVLSN
ncbi:unnamed protein product [Adineta steineri]|uniref:Uncharacterized protein n=1 Tax=Adineta steineri TaxID=433720 RepID=A0A816DUH3_9BILA|nr:unnamed protein product [Adineta steineri]CAF1641230.1 unnamed protein product [Adineta steineri]